VDYLLLQIVVSSALFGLIWIIQLAHYPAFMFIDPAKASSFHEQHSAALGVIAGPLMVAELALAGLLYLDLPSNLSLLNLGTVGVTWLSTFLVSVPIHNELNTNWNTKAIRRLILTNWPRTIVWTARIPLLIFWHTQ
jgi:hypothetical protein